MVDAVVASTPSGEGAARPEAASVENAFSGFDFDDRADFTVDTRTAWPVHVSFERRLSNALQSKVDRVKFVRLED
jgi:hypothetical protein